MTEYQPGTVAVATVRGVPNVRVMCSAQVHFDHIYLWTADRVIDNSVVFSDADVTDVRPRVVLDLDALGDVRFKIANVLETAAVTTFIDGSPQVEAINHIATQIREQTKPRIPEPGLYGVVSTEDHRGLTTYHWRSHDAWHAEDGHVREWDDLIDPVLVRDGIEDAS